MSQPDLAFPCPFCHGEVVVLTTKYGVIHKEPACERFMSLEPDEYLHAVNVALGNHPAELN